MDEKVEVTLKLDKEHLLLGFSSEGAPLLKSFQNLFKQALEEKEDIGLERMIRSIDMWLQEMKNIQNFYVIVSDNKIEVNDVKILNPNFLTDNDMNI